MEVLDTERYTYLYLCRVKLRRGEGWHIKPRSEKIDGLVAWFHAQWRITEDDSSIYVGEVAMSTDSERGVDIPGWVASGDLELIKKVRVEVASIGNIGEIVYPKGTEYVFEADKPPKQVYTLEEILAELEQ